MFELTPTGWAAVFSGTPDEAGRKFPVEGWDGKTGAALVVDAQLGRLRPVTEWENFSHLERGEQAVAAIPGNGWRLLYDSNGEEAGSRSESVLAWVISSVGHATPIVAASSGIVATTNAMEADQVIGPKRAEH